MARPTKCTQEMADELCDRIAAGESLRSICRDEHMPALSSVTLWIVQPDKNWFSAQYVQARRAAGFAHADKILTVANSVENGELEPQAGKVVIDAQKWVAERMAPKSHAVRQEMDHQSSDGSMSQPTKIQIVGVDPNGDGDQSSDSSET